MSLESIIESWQVGGAAHTVARQVGLGIGKSAKDLLGVPFAELSGTVKLALVAAIAVSIAVVVFKVG
jgi:hypothetical protein